VSERAVLVSGFGPFESFERNPSGAVAEALAAEPPAGVRVIAGVLPVSFARAPRTLDELLQQAGAEPPELLLGLGVQRKAGFRLERRARPRLKLVPRPDVDGRSPGEFSRDEDYLETGLALEPLLGELERRGVGEAGISVDAGGFVCEWVYHHLLVRARERGARALFVHVPPEHFTPLARQIEIVRAVLQAALT
jgi:pyroglutamyl-peptidase